MPSSTEDAPKGSLDRGILILNHLAKVREASTAEIVTAAGISRSATYRLAERLQELDYLVSSDNGRWRLGPGAARLAMASVQSIDIADAARELLRDLVRETRETVGLGVYSGGEIVFVHRELGPQSVQVRTELGARRPLHATSIGKAYLSGLPPLEASTVISGLTLTRYTDSTICVAPELEREIDEARQRGWSEEHGEFDPACTCFGAPVLDHSGTVKGAISVAGLTERMRDEQSRIGARVAAAAAAISYRLGNINEPPATAR